MAIINLYTRKYLANDR